MLSITTKKLSLLYNIKEDRMKLIINKNEKDQIEFWITRRFYFSLLFELETFLERLNISIENPLQKKKQIEKKKLKKEEHKVQTSQNKNKISEPVSKIHPDTTSTLMENISIHFVKKSKSFIFLFQAESIEAKSIFSKEQFLDFYHILKNTFPKGEWGIIQ